MGEPVPKISAGLLYRIKRVCVADNGALFLKTDDETAIVERDWRGKNAREKSDET